MYHTAGRRQKKRKNPREGNNTHVLEVKCEKKLAKMYSGLFLIKGNAVFICVLQDANKKEANEKFPDEVL